MFARVSKAIVRFNYGSLMVRSTTVEPEAIDNRTLNLCRRGDSGDKKQLQLVSQPLNFKTGVWEMNTQNLISFLILVLMIPNTALSLWELKIEIDASFQVAEEDCETEDDDGCIFPPRLASISNNVEVNQSEEEEEGKVVDPFLI